MELLKRERERKRKELAEKLGERKVGDPKIYILVSFHVVFQKLFFPLKGKKYVKRSELDRLEVNNSQENVST